MPRLPKLLLMLDDESFNLVQLVLGKAPIAGKGDWIEPELGNLPIAFHVDVQWLDTIRTEEHKAVRANSQDRGHGDPTSGDFTNASPAGLPVPRP
jgi:hypothetical protein